MKLKNLLVLLFVFTGLLHGSEEYSLEVRNARKVYKRAASDLGKTLCVRTLGGEFGRNFTEISNNFDLAQESMNKEASFHVYKNVDYEGMYVIITAYLPQAEPVPVPVVVLVQSCCTIS